MFTGTLHPYQVDDVDKMVHRGTMLVTYDLGTGKTVMSLAAIERLRDRGEITKPVLVIVPSSLKFQWELAIKEFTDSSCLVIDGPRPKRELQMTEVDYYKDTKIDYVITNYDQIVRDWTQMSRLVFDAVIVDEATAIKSFRAKRTKRVKDLARKVKYRYALTGTPVENGRPEELYSIMQFVDKGVLGNFVLFDEAYIVRNRFGGPERYRNLRHLHERLAPAVVRKSQSDPDVSPYLPDSIHMPPTLVRFDSESKALYNLIADSLLEDLRVARDTYGSNWSLESHYGFGRAGSEDALRGRAMAKVTALRMVCDFPQLLDLASGAGLASPTIAQLLADNPGVRIPGKSVKLEALVPLVEEHLDSDPRSKVVVFTSFVEMAHLISNRLVGSVVYTGKMSATEKEFAKQQFQTDDRIRILVSTDAGGYGMDLPEANMLVNFDLPWSAGLRTQRNGRIRRASSLWPSIVIRDILVVESIELRQHQMLLDKSAVANAVIDAQGIDDLGGVSLTAGSLTTFLQQNRP